MRFLVILLIPFIALSDDKRRPGKSGANMSWLDNGVIRIGCDLDFGGAITWLSESGSEDNIVNNFDAGRQIQLSFFSGPEPFEANGQKPKQHWKHIGWNPIQAGDDFGNGSKVTSHKNDGRFLSVDCIPLQWPLNGIAGECTYRNSIRLEKNVAIVSCEIVVDRSDKTWYRARHQEMPAIYTNGKWYRLVTYMGERPFTRDSLTEIAKKKPGGHPWSNWIATEAWSALVDKNDFGLGVWTPGTLHYTGGFAGKPGAGGTFDTHTGYMAPIQTEHIEAEFNYRFEYHLVLGDLEAIRSHVYKQRRPDVSWDFSRENEGRLGWTLHQGCKLQSKKNALAIHCAKGGGMLISPETFWTAEEANKLVVEAAWHPLSSATDGEVTRVFWRNWNSQSPAAENHVSLSLNPNGKRYRYEIDLKKKESYKGGMVQLRLDPPSGLIELYRIEVR